MLNKSPYINTYLSSKAPNLYKYTSIPLRKFGTASSLFLGDCRRASSPLAEEKKRPSEAGEDLSSRFGGAKPGGRRRVAAI